ncbi:MAG: peptidase, partial [Proteobacteria bacterium]|nr:peptidase [Pseudomonadota bacterium]
MNHETVAFAQMKDATQTDYDLLSRNLQPYLEETAQRVLETLQRQATERESGHQIHRLDHALQCATRARAEGAD